MKIIFNKSRLVEILKNENNLGFVPTMGNLHKGHKSLIRKSIDQNYKTIVSIFVNKPQFNRNNDFKNYPRNLKKDLFKLRKHSVDLLFLPKKKEIYPKGCNKKIKIDLFAKSLCGKFRPGHFKGVVDVIDRFIKIIKPQKIYLGEKDMQQLKIIDSFLKKNKINTKVVSVKTIREKNGMAYSSRNFLLSNKNKAIGSKIYKLLFRKKNLLINKKISINKIKKEILMVGADKIDYLELRDINKLVKPFKKNKKNKIFIAYYLNKVRLIDNI